MIHSMDIKVRGFHIDVFGHVNNARYLEFLESGRWGLLEEMADLTQLKSQGFVFVVVNININYRHPAYANETLNIKTFLNKIGRSSGVIRQTCHRQPDGKLIADADVTFVFVGAKTGQTVPIKGPILAMLEPHLVEKRV